MLAGVGRQCAV